MEKLAKYAKALAANCYLEVCAACDMAAFAGIECEDIRLEAQRRMLQDIKKIDDMVAEAKNE